MKSFDDGREGRVAHAREQGEGTSADADAMMPPTAWSFIWSPTVGMTCLDSGGERRVRPPHSPRPPPSSSHSLACSVTGSMTMPTMGSRIFLRPGTRAASAALTCVAASSSTAACCSAASAALTCVAASSSTAACCSAPAVLPGGGAGATRRLSGRGGAAAALPSLPLSASLAALSAGPPPMPLAGRDAGAVAAGAAAAEVAAAAARGSSSSSSSAASYSLSASLSR